MGRCTHSTRLLVLGRASPATVETVLSGSGIDSVSGRGDQFLRRTGTGLRPLKGAAHALWLCTPERQLKRSEVRDRAEQSLSK
jgi:hypothetical protein